MAAMIISRANMQLASKVREQIFFTLADHLTFAIERSRKGIAIQNRLLPEVRRFYPQQFRVASDAVTVFASSTGLNCRRRRPEISLFIWLTARARVTTWRRPCSR